MNKTKIESYIPFAKYIMPYALDTISYVQFESLYHADKLFLATCKSYNPKISIWPVALINGVSQLALNAALDISYPMMIAAASFAAYGTATNSNNFKMAGIFMNLYNIYSNHGVISEEVFCHECDNLLHVENNTFINHFNMSGHNYFNFSGEHHFNMSYYD